MKHTFLLTVVIFFSATIFAQEQPFSQQYLFNQSLVNPAIASRDNYIAVRFTDRHQWLGVTDAPVQQSLSVTNKFGKMGAGAIIYNEIYGPIRNTGMQFYYFYDLKLKADRIGSKLSFGISGSIFQEMLDETNLTTLEADPTITNSRQTAFYPNAGAGVFYYNKKFSLGLSVGNLIPSRVPIYTSEFEPSKERTYIIYSDYTYSNEINTFAVVPSLLFKIDEAGQKEININSKVYFQQFLWLGASYRDALETDIYKNQSMAALLGLRIYEMIYIGYSYDVELNSFQSYNSGSHEFMLGGNIYTKKQSMPRYF